MQRPRNDGSPQGVTNIQVERAAPVGRDAAGVESRISRAALEAAIRSVESRAFLVWPRVLRRVIKHDRHLAGLTVHLPHRKSLVVARDPLLEIVDHDELGLNVGDPLPDRVILLPQPSDAALAEDAAEKILLHYWRLLLHARIHLELDERIAAGGLNEDSVRQRIRQIGHTEFDEIRAVLAQEAFLLPPDDELGVYVEFVAVYWELRCFAQSLLPRYFPSIEDFPLVETVLSEDIEAERLFVATRLPGAPDPKTWIGSQTPDTTGSAVVSTASEPRTRADKPPAPPIAVLDTEAEPPDEPPTSLSSDQRSYHRWARRAEAATKVGNLVRSAICRDRAEETAPPESAAKARTALKRDVARLVRRLQVAMAIEDEDPQPWQETLLALVRLSPHGIWTVEARLLYDLQKVCVEHERGVYRIDLLGWIRSLGSQPIQRPLPAQREASISKHLRSATRRIASVRLTEAERQKLGHLLEAATHRAEIRLRDRFRPMISRALAEIGLFPRNLPEKVAFKKLVEELLDRIVEYGHLTMGDLRDAISRNNLKLPDFSWPMDVLRGDPLLRADRRLATSLDGVYRGGEFYLRWMQRLSSLGFGTYVGRLITRYVVVPFGGMFLIVTFLDHEVEKFTGTTPTTADRWWTLARIFVLGFFVLGLVNVKRFRHVVWQTLVDMTESIHDAVVGIARWVREWEWLDRLLHSRLTRLIYRFLLKPLVITFLAWMALPLEAVGWRTSAPSAVGLFLGINLLLNSRVGREVEEIVVDGSVQAWYWVGFPIITGVFYWIVDVFRAMLETVERLLYSVDEWLRFRSGESRLAFALKAVLGSGWALVTYFLRFCLNLLIEPQINPIKHFPVVTVSHKLLFVSIAPLGRFLSQTMDAEFAYTLATAIIWSIPGIFGFLVWELKENWRLYAANRSPELQPAMVGQHGETMVRLLRPGFHSGTLPKLFAKLRRAERHAMADRSRPAAIKQLRAVRRVQLAVRRFIDRELVELISLSPVWQSGPLALATVRLGTNRIHLAIEAAAIGDGPLEIAFEMRSGWLVAGIVRAGWADRLAGDDRRRFVAAIAGLYKMAGVDLVREQIDSQLPHAAEWDVVDEGLLVAPQGDMETEVFYPLDIEGPIEPQVVRGELWRAVPTLDPCQVLFNRVPVSWRRWVAFWQNDAVDPATPEEPIVPTRLLP